MRSVVEQQLSAISGHDETVALRHSGRHRGPKLVWTSAVQMATGTSRTTAITKAWLLTAKWLRTLRVIAFTSIGASRLRRARVAARLCEFHRTTPNATKAPAPKSSSRFMICAHHWPASGASVVHPAAPPPATEWYDKPINPGAPIAKCTAPARYGLTLPVPPCGP